MAKTNARDNVPLSRFGVVVAQLESVVASAAHKPPDPLLCFDLLSDLVSVIEEASKESILLWQRKCEDALYSLLVLGARRPVRHLASVAMARIILNGDSISVYSRASSLQGFLSDGKKNEPQQVAGAAQCLGELYRFFGKRITSGLLETTVIVTKLLKFNEDYVRQEALYMLKNALEGSGGNAAASAYTEAFRIIMRMGVGDKSFVVRIAAARCLKAFANVGGPGLGVGELENSSSYCVKALEDSMSAVRDAFAEALGALLALGMNPDAQVQPKGKGNFTPKKLELGLQRHLTSPFIKASGLRTKELRVGLALSWVSFLQAMQQLYLQPDTELQNFAVQVIDMLHVDSSVDAQALACVLYILRVGITDQMSEPTQRDFLVFFCKQLQSSDGTPSMQVAVLRTLSYALKTLGEVSLEFRDLLDDTVVASLSHHSPLVRTEAALTLRALAEVDPSCIGGLISYAVTMLSAMRENVSFEKGTNLKVELDSLHGQVVVLAALVSISPKLPLGYPARLPRSVLEVSKKMLMESSRNPVAASVEREAGWILLSSLLASMPKEELEDQVFDILSLWTSLFSRSAEYHFGGDLTHSIHVCSAAIDALTAFIKCFVSSDGVSKRILLQPVLLYLSRALTYISVLATKEQTAIKPAMEVFITRTLIAYQSISDPATYSIDHSRIIQICTTPFSDAPKCEESSCLRMLLDKRDAWLGPWIPGRDLFEDELRSFQGGKDGVLPCVWDNELPSFPQPETTGKMLVNQMLLCFGTIFASQDSGGMLSLLSMIEQCLKAGKKQAWHAASVTNICVGLLAGLKALLALRPEPLGLEILNAAHSIFQSILAEGDICPSQRRASSEGLGLLARLGNDIFAARLTRSLLGDVSGPADSNYAGSVAMALGCIHRSAGGMALSSLVPATVNSLSLLAKSSVTGLQIWSLHGLILTIEASGLSYVSQVQATLGLAMEILLSHENGLVDLQQGVGRLINAIVAVLGPELAPGSIFFSRCKAVVAEINSRQETATLLESARFTQQLVLFAPQAVSVHFHVQSLLPTLSSRQPTLRHLALSTLRHLIEKDPVSIIDEQIEETLFLMLDEETDDEIGGLARTTIMRLLYASCPSRPSHWLSICRDMILATSSRKDAGTNSNSENDPSTVLGGETRLNLGEDDENMVSHSKNVSIHGRALNYSSLNAARDKHLRYRTRVFAAECLSHLPGAVGSNPAHFDLSIARGHGANKLRSKDWLVVKLQELVSLAYQISTIQFENMRPIGITLLSTIVDKFGMIPDPELPGHILLEQYQAQLVSAVRTALDQSSGPVLLEAGLQLATKILTSGVIRQDQVAVKRIFSLISRPLDDFNDLYYPSFAEWVSCKIKVRLLTAHASLKCYTYTFLKRQHDDIPEEYQALLPLFSKSSLILGKYWLSTLEDYCHTCFHSHLKDWRPFLDGIQSSLGSTRLLPCLEEAWPFILQALTLDAFPVNFHANGSLATENRSKSAFTSGYSMVELKAEDFQFLYGFSLLALFQRQAATLGPDLTSVGHVKSKLDGDFPVVDANSLSMKPYGIVFPVLQSLCAERFFSSGFAHVDICRELLQVISYIIFAEDTWDSLAVSLLSEIVENCPKDFLETDKFSFLASELCSSFLFKFHLRKDAISPYYSNWEDISSVSTKLLQRCEPKMQLKSLLGFLLIGYKCLGGAPTELSLSRANTFIQSISSILRELVNDKSKLEDDGISNLTTICSASLNAITTVIKHNIKSICEVENKKSDFFKLLQMKLAISLEQSYSLARLSFDINYPLSNEETNSILFSVLHHAIQHTRAVLTSDDTQVLAIGLQVTKGVLQKGIGADFNSFLIFFLGELIGELSLIIEKFLQKSINREGVVIIGECLRILMLLQTLPKDSACQKGLISLILEVVVMVTSVDHFSQDFNDLKSTAIKVVSQLAQIPSSASYFKDVLVMMPITRRQQLQDIVRASVAQDQNPTHAKNTRLPLAIKLPAQMEKAKERDSPPLAPREESHDISEEKDPRPSAPTKESSDVSEEEEEDDWDNFQSFPASTNESGPTSEMPEEDSTSVWSPTVFDDHDIDNENKESSSSLPVSKIEECPTADHESSGRERTDDTAIRIPVEESQNFNAEPLGAHHQVRGKVVVSHNDDQSLPEAQSAEERPKLCEKSKEIAETVPHQDKSQSPSDTKNVESSVGLSDYRHDKIPSEDSQTLVEQQAESAKGHTKSLDSSQQQKDTENPENITDKSLV